MAEYHVQWEIDVTALDPRSAAAVAFLMVQAPTTATVFDVFDPESGETTQVDLGTVH